MSQITISVPQKSGPPKSYKISDLSSSEMQKFVPKLTHNLQSGYIQLGKMIQRAIDEDLWQSWNGKTYKSFDEFCDKELGFQTRKAQILSFISNRLEELDLSPADMKAAIEIGQMKLHEILRVATDAKGFRKWHAFAVKLSHRDLIKKVQKAKGHGSSSPAGEAHSVVSFKAKLADDGEAETVEKALDAVMTHAGVGSKGKALALMSTYYLANAPAKDEADPVERVQLLIDQMEEAYPGLRLKMVKAPKALPKPEEPEEDEEEEEEEEEEVAEKKPSKKAKKKKDKKSKGEKSSKKAKKKKAKKIEDDDEEEEIDEEVFEEDDEDE